MITLSAVRAAAAGVEMKNLTRTNLNPTSRDHRVVCSTRFIPLPAPTRRSSSAGRHVLPLSSARSHRSPAHPSGGEGVKVEILIRNQCHFQSGAKIASSSLRERDTCSERPKHSRLRNLAEGKEERKRNTFVARKPRFRILTIFTVGR